MLAKYWKKICLVILIIACIFNIMSKFVHKLYLNQEIESSETYVNEQDQQQDDKKLDK